MLSAEAVFKGFRGRPVLHNISFSVDSGETVVLLGPNGAGKTTLLDILAGASEPDSGQICWDGRPRSENLMKYQSRIGFMPDAPPLYDELTAEEFLNIVGTMKLLGEEEQRSGIEAVIKAFRLGDVRKRICRTLSRGYRQRLGLAQAFLGSPELVILDEPTNTLDPGQIADLRKWIADRPAHQSVIISTHILSEAENLCDRALLLSDGEIKADVPAENLEDLYQSCCVRE